MLLSFASALVSLRLGGQLARRRRYAWAGGLFSFAAATAAMAWGVGARLGCAHVPRLLPRRRAPVGAAPRGRLAAAHRPALGGARRARLHRPRVRDRAAMPVHGSVRVDQRAARTGPRRRPAARGGDRRQLARRGRRGGRRGGRRCDAGRVGNALIVAAVAAAAAASALTQTAVAAAAACFAAAALLL